MVTSAINPRPPAANQLAHLGQRRHRRVARRGHRQRPMRRAVLDRLRRPHRSQSCPSRDDGTGRLAVPGNATAGTPSLTASDMILTKLFMEI